MFNMNNSEKQLKKKQLKSENNKVNYIWFKKASNKIYFFGNK